MTQEPPRGRIGRLARMLRPGKPEQGRVERDVPYGPDADQKLDFYYPAKSGQSHLVVYLHGGGWIHGSKGTGRRIAPPLTQHGYAMASIGYRRFPRVDVRGEMGDAACAIAFLLGAAARFGIDPSSFSLMGHSSGAHMAALLATDASYFERAGVDGTRLHAVIALDGVFDVTANLTHYPSRKNDEVFGRDPKAWPAVSPIDKVAGMIAHPRFCLINEDENPRFVEQEALFEAELKKRGETVEAVTASGLGHGQVAAEFADPALPMAQAVLDCLEGE